MLLALKLLANRGVRDTDDYHHQEVMSASAEARVKAWIEQRVR